METNSKDFAKVGFVKRILIVDVALLIMAGIISLVLNFSFGIILFALGMLVGGMALISAVQIPMIQIIRSINILNIGDVLLKKKPTKYPLRLKIQCLVMLLKM